MVYYRVNPWFDDVHSSNIIRHIINDVCSQNHRNVWRHQKDNMKSKKYGDPAHVCAQGRKWIYSVFGRILSWEVDLLSLIELLVIFYDFWCFNATFRNISAISWRPVLVAVSKSGNPGPGPVPKTRAQIRIFFITSLLRH